MKKKILLFVLIIVASTNVFAEQILEILKNLPHVVNVEELKSNTFFEEKYLLLFEQPIDHNNPELGTFNQRVFVMHKSFDIPVVFTTEGYSADYAESNKYMNELALILITNEIVVEHRFFSKSVPDSIQWRYLTTSNAAADHHEVYESLKKIYTKKWLSTGISKGGETCLLYQMYYPKDMTATVAYVAPVAKNIEDERAKIFIEKNGSIADRKKILEFQTEILKRRKKLYPIFLDYIDSRKLSFRIPFEEVYDYCVLEFSFAFWQWVGNTEKIPDKKAKDNDLINFLLQISGPEYFSIEDSKAIFAANYMFAAELGYYGYDIKNFISKKTKLLTINDTEGYFNKIFIPKDMNIVFNDSCSKKLEKFLKTEAFNTFLIYGEYDPWTAAAPNIEENKNVVKIINPRGTHATRITLLPKENQMQIIKQLQELMY